MRQAERALFDLRRGLPILLRQPAGDTLVQAVEGLDDDALAALQSLTGATPRLVPSKHRMAALGHRGTADAVSLTLSPLPSARTLRELAWMRGAALPAAATETPASPAEGAAGRLLGLSARVPAGGCHAYTLAAEREGGAFAAVFEALLAGWQEQGWQLVSLGELAASLDMDSLPRCNLKWEAWPRRPGERTQQGDPAFAG